MTQVSSLYLHVPFCKHLCNYCDFYKQKLEAGSGQIDGFHQFLKDSWPRHQDLMEQHSFEFAPLETLYFGGGTPSLWGIEGAKFWKTFFPIPLKADAEFTMEIDPGTWNQDFVAKWKEIGLNRISIGTQSLNPDFLKILDRAHSLDESLKLLHYCSKNRWNFSLDFLLGVPYSKDKNRNIKHELDQLLDFFPKHISLYILNARSKYPYINQIPDDEYIRDEYLFVSEYLRSQGFTHYEVSNFALPGYESRHNLKYWCGQSVAALGPTGTGLLSKSESEAIRYKWKVTKAEFEIEKLGEEEIKLEQMYLALRTSQGWEVAMTAELKKVLEKWELNGLANYDSGRVKLSAKGFIVLDSLMNDLFTLRP